VTGLGEIIRSYGDAYCAKYGERMSPSHRRTLLAAPVDEAKSDSTEADSGDATSPPATICPTCGGPMTRRQASPVRHKPP